MFPETLRLMKGGISSTRWIINSQFLPLWGTELLLVRVRVCTCVCVSAGEKAARSCSTAARLPHWHDSSRAALRVFWSECTARSEQLRGNMKEFLLGILMRPWRTPSRRSSLNWSDIQMGRGAKFWTRWTSGRSNIWWKTMPSLRLAPLASTAR